MKKIKNMMKKGAIADIITIIVIVGLVVALIIGVVLPMVTKTNEGGEDAIIDLETIVDTNMEDLRDDGSFPSTNPNPNPNPDPDPNPEG